MAKMNHIDQKDMTDEQQQCFALLCTVFGGPHHLPRVYDWGGGIKCNLMYRLATTDFSHLTHLVVLAHDRCIRVEVGPCNAQCISVVLHKRTSRVGDFWARHPTIEDAIQTVRNFTE